MPRPVRPWFRLYTETFADRKLRRMRPEYRWLYVACLGSARQSPVAGELLVSEGQPVDATDLADYAGMDVRTVKAGMRVLVDNGLIVERSLGDRGEIVWSSPTFQSRQYESDDSTKRTRKHRLTREDADVGTALPRSREQRRNGGRNAPESETETETDIESPRKRATAIDPAWLPAPEVRQAIAQELPDVDLKAEHAKFVDHFTANGKTMKDWTAAWRNWMRRSTEFGRPAKPQTVADLPPAYRETPAPDPESLPW